MHSILGLPLNQISDRAIQLFEVLSELLGELLIEIPDYIAKCVYEGSGSHLVHLLSEGTELSDQFILLVF